MKNYYRDNLTHVKFCNGPLVRPFTPRRVGVSTTTEGLRRGETIRKGAKRPAAPIGMTNRRSLGIPGSC